MSGTNFTKGVAVRTKYSGVSKGDTDVTDQLELQTSASTKFIRRQAVIRCRGSDAASAERTTDFTFPAKAIVHNVYLNVITADATETVSVGTEGTSNDPDGFLVNASLASTGLVVPILTTAAETLGALLTDESEAGTTDATVQMDAAIGADPVSYTCSAGTDTAVFDIIIDYTEVVEEA